MNIPCLHEIFILSFDTIHFCIPDYKPVLYVALNTIWFEFHSDHTSYGPHHDKRHQFYFNTYSLSYFSYEKIDLSEVEII